MGDLPFTGAIASDADSTYASHLRFPSTLSPVGMPTLSAYRRRPASYQEGVSEGLRALYTPGKQAREVGAPACQSVIVHSIAVVYDSDDGQVGAQAATRVGLGEF